MRHRLLLLPVLLTGCSLTVNQPSLTANTAVGDGSRVVGGGGAPAIAPAGPAAPGAGGAAAGTPTAPPADSAPPDPAGAGIRDQQALKTTMAVEASLDSRAAQTFVAGRSGRLGAVGLRLAIRGERAPEAVLRLHAAPDGGPQGPALAEAPVPAGDVTKDRDERWVLARFAAPPAVEQGKRYAWVLLVAGAFPLAIGAGDNRSYEAGEAWTSGRAAEVWSRQGLDLAFRTYLAD